MSSELLLDEFDHLVEAPAAVQHLRRFILDLAVHARLVEQVPGEEPASKLLSRIESHMSDRRTHRRKYASVSPQEAPFPLPAGWEWVRVRQIATDREQTRPTEPFTYIDVGSIDKEAGRIADATVLSADGAPSRARKIVHKGDVLYSCVRPYLLNIAVVEDHIKPKPIASTAFAVLNAFGLVAPRYLWTVLRSPFMVEQVELKMRGQAYPAINDSDFAQLPFPLAPLAEQERIVAKVDELMALCDQLELAQTERESRRDRFGLAMARALATAQEKAQIAASSQVYLQNFENLFARTDQVPLNRQIVIDLAVRGLLVGSSPTDDPASDLLRQVNADRKRLAGGSRAVSKKAGRLFDECPEPYVIPPQWTWTTLGSLGVTQTGSTPKTSGDSYRGTDIPFIKPGDMTRLGVDYGNQGLSTEGLRASGRVAQVGTLLMVCIGGTLGKCDVIDRECSFNQQINAITLLGGVLPKYVLCVCKSSFFQRVAWGAAAQGTLPILNKGNWERLPVPLPPLAEQHRIVAGVDKLMQICDELEHQLIISDEKRGRLLRSLVAEALGTEIEHGMVTAFS